jgi:hypothetical protein
VERTQEEIAAHQDVLVKFKERFPKSTMLQSFTVDPERPLDAIRETLERHSKQVQNVIETYKQTRMPLQMFAGLIGRDLYETWFAVISNPDLALFSGAGTDEEIVEAQRLLEAATAFIIEPITMFTLYFLGLGPMLTRIGDIYVAQRTLDYLHEMEAKRGPAETSTTGTIGMVDGRFFMQEFTPDELKQKNAALHSATAWAEKHAKPIGLKEPFTKDDKKWLKILGEANLATIVTAKQRSMVLLTDDKILGDLAKQNYGVSSVNTQALLLYLLQREILSRLEYDGAVVKLLEAGYTTRVDESQLFRVIVDEQFQVTPRLKNVLRVLEPTAAPLGVTCAIAAGLIRRVFLEPLPDEIRVQMVWSILDTVAKNHPKIEVQRLVRGLLRQQMRPLLVLHC